MKIQYVSDLHIDKHPTPISPFELITPSADILILAGDIGSFYNIDQLKTFILPLSHCFKLILYVPGNHEYYFSRKHKFRQNISTLYHHALELEEIPNLYLMNSNSIRIGKMCICGCTMWTKYKYKELPKYVRIKGMTQTIYNDLHKRQIEYMRMVNSYCQENGYQLIMVTHHNPLSVSVLQPDKKKKFDPYESLYYADLNVKEFNTVSYWIYGHTHKSVEVNVSNIQFLSNQLGRTWDVESNYKKERTFEVEV